MTESLKVLSLFSGVGGFDLGLERAGMETVFQCEWDKHATKVLERHWPNVPRWGDISTLSGHEVFAKVGRVDVVAWGSPCQDLSLAGKRAGLSGERSGLFHEGIRIIKELQEASDGRYPTFSIWENVAGALSSNGGADFGRVLDEMADLGAMVIEWAVLDAQYFGVPQRRRRVFVVAVFNSAIAGICPDPLLPVGEGLRRNLKKGKQTGKDIAVEVANSVGETHSGEQLTLDDPVLIDRAAFNQGVNAQYVPHISDDPIAPSLVARGPHAVFTKTKRAQSATDDETWVEAEVNPTLNSFDVGDVRSTTAVVEPILIDGRRNDDVRVYSAPVQTLQERMGTGGNNVPVIGFSHTQGLSAQPSEEAFPTLRTEGAGMAVAYDEYNDAVGGEVHHALRAGTKQSTGLIEPSMAVRRLTPVECERLMGWPDDWTANQTDGHRYRQCGNGVASPVAEWIGRQLVSVVEQGKLD